MTTRAARDLQKALTSKGFRCAKTHHEMYWLFAHGKKTSIRTRISHGQKEYDTRLLGQMARQVGLTREEFADLIDCPLEEQPYLELLIKRGRIRLKDN